MSIKSRRGGLDNIPAPCSNRERGFVPESSQANPPQIVGKSISCGLLKKAQMQGAPACGRQAKSFVGNGFKPFLTIYAADACLW
jgi:hypothetical protein